MQTRNKRFKLGEFYVRSNINKIRLVNHEIFIEIGSNYLLTAMDKNNDFYADSNKINEWEKGIIYKYQVDKRQLLEISGTDI